MISSDLIELEAGFYIVPIKLKLPESWVCIRPMFLKLCNESYVSLACGGAMITIAFRWVICKSEYFLVTRYQKV
ncbi:hypothetical protein PspS34_08790 [Pseudomonas sp. S34]|nr:hypothetical protein PspS34_08790 [Pseudomonas sp. S34]